MSRALLHLTLFHVLNKYFVYVFVLFYLSMLDTSIDVHS